MPLTVATIGQIYKITKVGGKEETKQFLNNLGFVVGADITVINTLNGNLIVNIKGTRVAISQDMALKILI